MNATVREARMIEQPMIPLHPTLCQQPEPCCARLPNLPHMSLGSENTDQRAAPLRTSQNVLLQPPFRSDFSLPALQLGKEAPHPRSRVRLGHARVVLGHDGRAEIDHLLHGAVLGKGSVLIAVGAVVGIGRAVLLGAQLLRSAGEGHAAALTKFLFQYNTSLLSILLFLRGTGTG